MKILKLILLAFLVLFIIYDSKNHIKYYNIEVGELCLIKRTTGFPCPACGMTRAHIEAIRLNFKKAFYYHPLFLFPAIIFAVIILKNKSKIANYIYNNNYIIFTFLFIFIVVYIVRFVLLFPNREPFTYNYDSNLYIILKFFKNIF
ncbi:DUF2752 domain-containing protein [Brachyspira murdochii]|uniref:DUF2752 domain-containing protein n=1 Tax=Brachyspira murdochii TaxID=84378 RepID=UPI0012F4A9A2|nr:DUF2752 domain-containing protein [Brachyspira murdochii]